MYLIAYKEGGRYYPVFDNRPPHIIIANISSHLIDFVCIFECGWRYDDIIARKPYIDKGWTPDISRDEFLDMWVEIVDNIKN